MLQFQVENDNLVSVLDELVKDSDKSTVHGMSRLAFLVFQTRCCHRAKML